MLWDFQSNLAMWPNLSHPRASLAGFAFYSFLAFFNEGRSWAVKLSSEASNWKWGATSKSAGVPAKVPAGVPRDQWRKDSWVPVWAPRCVAAGQASRCGISSSTTASRRTDFGVCINWNENFHRDSSTATRAGHSTFWGLHTFGAIRRWKTGISWTNNEPLRRIPWCYWQGVHSLVFFVFCEFVSLLRLR